MRRSGATAASATRRARRSGARGPSPRAARARPSASARRRMRRHGIPGQEPQAVRAPTRKFEKSRLQEEAAIIVEYGLRNKRGALAGPDMLANHRRERGPFSPCPHRRHSRDVDGTQEARLLDPPGAGWAMLGRDADIDQSWPSRSSSSWNAGSRRSCTGKAWHGRQAGRRSSPRHIAIGTRKVTIPGYLVSRAEESEVCYAPHSPILNEVHPERARIAKVGGEDRMAGEKEKWASPISLPRSTHAHHHHRPLRR